MIESVKKQWVKPSLICLDNSTIKTGIGGAYMETIAQCDGPLAGNPENTDTPAPGNAPDCGAVTMYATYVFNTPNGCIVTTGGGNTCTPAVSPPGANSGGTYLGGTGTIVGMFATTACFGPCS